MNFFRAVFRILFVCVLAGFTNFMFADKIDNKIIDKVSKNSDKNTNKNALKPVENKAENKTENKTENIAYSIQVGSFKSAENAGYLADFLNKSGLDAFFFKDDDMYKVRFGNYESMAKAKSEALKHQAERLIDSFFIVEPKSYAINQQKSKEQKVKTLRESLSKHAHSYIDTPYKWGGESSSGFDCSGLVRAVYRLNGLDLPRTSRDQFSVGTFVLKKDLQVGDLVFFSTNKQGIISHVGIYIGNNQFIHAPGRGKKVTIANLESNYWKKIYKGARRYL